MRTGRKFFLLALILLLAAGMFTGCGLIEQWRETRQVERQARALAERYLAETYGQRGRIMDVEVAAVQAGVFGVSIQPQALLTVLLDGELFKVYVETSEPAFCADNRQGMALAADLEEYFRALYRLPEAYSHSVNLYFEQEGFFADHPTHIAREENFLPFAYEGQPLEEVLPLLDKIYFRCDFLDDSVSLSGVELREEDWGGPLDRLWLRLRCFRMYDPEAEVPLGIRMDGSHPVLVAAGMQFSRRGSGYGTLNEIASGLTSYALREAMEKQGEKFSYSQYTLTRMGNFWISTREGFRAEDCFELRNAELDWGSSLAEISVGITPYYSQEELLEESLAESTRKEIPPYFDARYRQVGELLCLKEGALERMEAWESWGPNQDDKFPVFVMANPALVYQADSQMGAGILFQKEEGVVCRARIFNSFLEKENRWLNGLSFLGYYFPQPSQAFALLEVYPPDVPDAEGWGKLIFS